MPTTEEDPFDFAKATEAERRAYRAGYQAAIDTLEVITGRQYHPSARPEILTYKFDDQGRLAPVLAGRGIETLEQLRSTSDKELLQFLTLEEVNILRKATGRLADSTAENV